MPSAIFMEISMEGKTFCDKCDGEIDGFWFLIEGPEGDFQVCEECWELHLEETSDHTV